MEPYKICGIDVHRNVMVVVIADPSQKELRFERRKFGAQIYELRQLRDWLKENQVRDVVMESTAQYWKSLWRELEPDFHLYLAQAQSNRAPKGRKYDYRDAERLARRYLAGELILSFVPGPEQRLWRMLTHTRAQLSEDRVRLRNQMEGLLEDARIKLHCLVTDLLGVSARRILKAIAAGCDDAAALGKMRERQLKATPGELELALEGVRQMSAEQRLLLGMDLERLELIDRQMAELEQTVAGALKAHQEAVARLVQVPGFGANAALQVIAEVGPEAATFPSARQLASWVGACPGREEAAGKSRSDQAPKGNRATRRILAQVAQAAVKTQGSIFEKKYQRLKPRLGSGKALWAIVNHLCEVVWIVLHKGARYVEKGAGRNLCQIRRRVAKLKRDFQTLGLHVQLTPILPTGSTAMA